MLAKLGVSLTDLASFLWAVGPAAVGIILLYFAEFVIAPKRQLNKVLGDRIAHNYTLCSRLAYIGIFIFIPVWVVA